MDVLEALKTRKSVRAYLDKDVEKNIILKILNAARYTPSGVNTQPWQVAVVSGEKKQFLERKIQNAFLSGQAANMDYDYYPSSWFTPYKERRYAVGMQLYKAIDIDKGDAERRREQWARNYSAFGAPAVLFIFMDRGLGTGSYIDCGMFIQSLMLGAVSEGLATCPEAALAEYPDIVRESLGYSRESLLLCGLALGYEDVSDPVNSFRTHREELESFVRFF